MTEAGKETPLAWKPSVTKVPTKDHSLHPLQTEEAKAKAEGGEDSLRLLL